jgi:hypothetical protein
MATYIPGTEEQDQKKVIMSLQQVGPKLDTAMDDIATNTADIATQAGDIASLQSDVATLLGQTFVASIESATGALTLNETSGIELSSQDIRLRQGSSSQFGAVKVDNTTLQASSGVLSTKNPALTSVTGALGADVALNNTANFFDGPSINPGTGVWFVSGTVTINDTTAAGFYVKLWDGTTVIASAAASIPASSTITVSVSGVITNPASNVKISVRDITATSGSIKFNTTGSSKDSHITAVRIG